MKPTKKPLDFIATTFLLGGAFVMGGGLIAAALEISAMPAEESTQTSRALPGFLEKDGLNVVKRFPSAGGLEGVVLETGGPQHLIAYLTPDGHVVIGSLFDRDGKNLTVEHGEAHVPAPDYANLWEEAESSAWVAEAAGTDVPAAVVYVFLDPNCAYCKLAWKALQPYRAAGLEIRWMPVAFLAEDSMAKSAQLFAARTPEEVEAHLKGFLAEGAGVVTTTVDPALQEKVEANNTLMRERGFQGTPVVIYRDADGVVQVKQGMFRLSEIPALTGLDAIADDSPELAPFR